MRNIIRLSMFVMIVMLSIFGPAESSMAQSATSKSDIPWARLWNKTFASDYSGKEIQLTAQWIGVAQMLMHVAGSVDPWNKMVEVGITSVGSVKGGAFGQYENQQWAVFIPKDESDIVFTLPEGAKVKISAKADMFNSLGIGEQIVLTITKIEKVD